MSLWKRTQRYTDTYAPSTVINFILLAQSRIHGEERGEVAVGRCMLPVRVDSCTFEFMLVVSSFAPGVRADGIRRVARQAWRRSGVWEVARREFRLAWAFSWGLLRHVSRFFYTITERLSIKGKDKRSSKIQL